jgi:hypothetical protein
MFMSVYGGTRYCVTGADSLEMPLRVLNLFVQFGYEPDRVSLDRCAAGFELLVELPHGGDARASILLEKVRAMTLVIDARSESILATSLAA